VHQGIQRVVVETDSMMVKLESNAFSLAPAGLVYEIRCMAMLNFTSFSVSYVPKECNWVVLAVAAFGCKHPHNETLRWEGTPVGLEDLVLSDSASPSL
jgi:hypothetical protein